MILLPRTISWTCVRILLAATVLGVGLFVFRTTGDLHGQAPAKSDAPPKQKKPRNEEEEDDPKPPTKRKVIRVEGEEPESKAKPRPDAPPPPWQTRTPSGKAGHPVIERLRRELAVPHDHIVFRKLDLVSRNQQPGRQSEWDVEPIPVYLGNNPTKERKKGVILHPLNKSAKLGRSADSIESVQPYERIAQEQVRAFLAEKFDDLPAQDSKHLSRLEMLAAAEEALSTALRWHESAKETGARKGEEWAAVEADLRKQLLDDVMLKQLRLLAEARDWERLLARTRLLAVTYAGKADRDRIAKPLAELLQNALDDPSTGEKKQEIRKRLHQLEEEFPDNAAFRPIGQGLEKQAALLLEKAQELSKDKNDKERLREALDLVRQAEEFAPRLPGLHALKLSLSAEHPVLRVGIRGPLPRYFSPALACTDSERRAMEMLFEGLVKLSPDTDGIFHYRPGLAERLPKVAPLGRRFRLPRNAMWSDGKQLLASDVLATVNLLKTGVGTGRSCAWGQLLGTPVSKSNPYEVTLRLNQGFLDPLALMTFKILPRNQPVDTKEFAQHPVCGGPFFLDAKRHSDEQQRPCVIFIANPSYGGRQGKRDLPRIQEVRFYSYTDPWRELGPAGGNPDLLLDLTAKEVEELQAKASALRLTVPLPARTTPNRRIYFLAINQQKVPDVDLRRALALAINREALLDQFFRGPLKRQVHKALGGPFPAGCWACNPLAAGRRDKSSPDLFDADAAKALSQKEAVQRIAQAGSLKLKYPEGDPLLTDALKALCEQVKTTTGITLELSACDPYQLREDVEQTQSYELAYYHYDFPDETYWLWPLLGQSGRVASASANYLNFSDRDIQSLLQRAMGHRDFAEVRACLKTVQEHFVGGVASSMPFIPLWQLDPLFVYRHDVHPVGLDSLSVFSNIEQWRLERR